MKEKLVQALGKSGCCHALTPGTPHPDPGLSGFPSAWTDASDGGGNELLVTGTGAWSKSVRATKVIRHSSLSPLLLRFAARASQESLAAAAGDRVLEHVCEVSGSTASLAVSRPGTAGIQPATEQPAAAATDPAGKPGTFWSYSQLTHSIV
ncbi:unnamed protein product [Pleuronectes platessa]|uniref:Uncharacterized protein n=1 Tax=Pleuronectes platessa TaxID=8262 RepID=A0A9N7YBP5_PLEPL|nr:unnamed protein product [Pleuronectes platessa]